MNTPYLRSTTGISLVLLMCIAISGQAQPSDSLSLQKKSFHSALRANRSLSYLTLTQGVGNLEPLVFEANVATNYFISSKKGRWALQLAPRILLRMRNEKSYPIVNPSYVLPLLYHQHLHFWSSTVLGSLLYPESYFSLGFQHHSNGQSGPFFLKDGSINREKGSFATNFFSVAITGFSKHIRNQQRIASSLQLQYERHLPGLSFEENPYPHALEGRYGLDRLFVTYNKFDLSRRKGNAGSGFFQNSGLMTKAGWIFGGLSYKGSSEISNRLVLQLRYVYSPSWLNEIALFAGYYRGQDYYNMYFDRNLYVFRLGLISNPLGKS